MKPRIADEVNSVPFWRGLEVEIENERSGRTYEREFQVKTKDGIERTIELTFGDRDFEMEIEVEQDREDDTVMASLEIERLTYSPADDLMM